MAREDFEYVTEQDELDYWTEQQMLADEYEYEAYAASLAYETLSGLDEALSLAHSVPMRDGVVARDVIEARREVERFYANATPNQRRAMLAEINRDKDAILDMEIADMKNERNSVKWIDGSSTATDADGMLTIDTPAPAPKRNSAVATSLNDMITPKQLGMIRRIADDANVNVSDECFVLHGCSVSELNKRAASDLIDHLQAKMRALTPATPFYTPAQEAQQAINAA